MLRAGRGSVAGAALATALLAGSARGAVLEVVDDAGQVIFAAEVAPESRWCLVWNHSVTGIEVEDCFRQDGGRLVLDRSHQPDFAAGLGHTPGRGVQVSDGEGGYWIEDMDVAIPGNALPLRVGGPGVDHRLALEGREVSLTALAAGRRVTLRMRFPEAPR